MCGKDKISLGLLECIPVMKAQDLVYELER